MASTAFRPPPVSRLHESAGGATLLARRASKIKKSGAFAEEVAPLINAILFLTSMSVAEMSEGMKSAEFNVSGDFQRAYAGGSGGQSPPSASAPVMSVRKLPSSTERVREPLTHDTILVACFLHCVRSVTVSVVV